MKDRKEAKRAKATRLAAVHVASESGIPADRGNSFTPGRSSGRLFYASAREKKAMATFGVRAFRALFEAGSLETAESYEPARAAPVDVEVEDGGGFVRRSMRFVGDGPMKGKTLRQHIYVDAASHEIRFVGEEVEGQEAPIEVVNALRLEPHLSIEYYQRDRLTGERVHWKAPRARTIAAIERTIALARSAGEVAGEAEGAAE